MLLAEVVSSADKNAGTPLVIPYGVDAFWIVFWGTALATFVASIMAKEQDDRLRNGTFGVVASGTLGGIAALLTKQDMLLLVGFLGSGVGAFVGWAISLGLSFLAALTPVGRTVLEYQIGGWEAVRARLDLKQTEPLLKAMSAWGRSFTRRIEHQKGIVVQFPEGDQTNRIIELSIRTWLESFVDVLSLLFELAEKPQYRSRVTIIVYGRRENIIVGKHWLSDSGNLESHKTNQEFNDASIGYKVLTEQIASPYFTTGDDAKQQGQNRGQQTYRPFITFRLTDSCILALDWPYDLKPDNQFVQAARNLFHEDVCPLIRDVLNHWHGHVQNTIGLAPL